MAHSVFSIMIRFTHIFLHWYKAKIMNPLIKRVISAGLAILPTACATYSQGYYDTGYSYSPGYYGSGYGYGVVERNYYDTYTAPTPVYRMEEHHYHYDGHNRRYPDRHDHDGRRYPASPGTVYRNPGFRSRDAKAHYNWNTRAAKPYDTRKFDRDRQGDDERHAERQQRSADPNVYGQWGRRQNGERQEDRRRSSGFGEHAAVYDKARSGWQNNAPVAPKHRQDGQVRQRPGRGRSPDQRDMQNGQ
jgi:hypothetical protein